MASRIEIPIDGNPEKLKRAAEEASQALDKIDRAGQKLADTTKSQSAAAEETTKQLTKLGLAGVAAAAGFVAMAEKAISATANFKDLGLAMGGSAAAISRFEESAALANMRLETLVGAMNRLSRASIEARDPTSAAGLALKAFNINAQEFSSLRVDEQFEALARASEKYGGSAEKNAALMALTGRSGAELQKVFSEIAAKAELVSTVTNEQAEAADALQDKWSLVVLEGKRVARDSTAVLVPALDAILTKFVEIKGAGTAWTATMEAAGGILKFGAGVALTFATAIQDLGDRIGAVAAKTVAFLTTNWRAISEIDKAQSENSAARAERVVKIWRDLFAAQQTMESKDNWDLQGGRRTDFDPKADAERRRAEHEAEMRQMAERAAAQKNLMDNLKALAEAEKEYEDAHAKELDATGKGIIALRDSNESLRTEIEAIGLSRVERELLLNTKAKERQLNGALDQGQRENIIAMREQTAEMIKQRAELQNNQALAQRATADQARMWDDLGNHIVNAFETGGASLKNLLRDMLALFAKKWILQIGADMTGNATLASQAGSLGNGSFAGSMLGNVTGSLFTGGSLLASNGLVNGLASGANALGLSGVSNFLGGATGAIQGPTLTGAALGGEAAAAGASAASSLAAAMPYIAAALAVYALIKKFGDKGENPKAMLGFGGNAAAYTTQGVFGAEGFKSIQTEDGFNKSLQTFFEGLKGMDERIAKMLQPGQVEAIKNTLANTAQREFAFPKGDGTAGAQLTKEYLQQKYGAVFGQLSPGIGDKIKNFAGSDKELLDYITQTVAAFDSLQTAMDAIKGTIGEVTGGTAALEQQLKDLRGSVDAAQSAFDMALKGGDPTAMMAAEQDLVAAVQNRYNIEKQAIASLVQGIESLKSSAYDFAMSNGARINKYGGSVNLGAIASGRLGDLRASITAGGTPEDRLANIGAFVSVLDQWVGAEQSALEANAQGAAAIAQAQAAAAQSTVQALQQQLQLAQSWKGVLDSVEQTIDRMRFSGSNPLSTVSRFGAAGEDVNGLLGQYRSATGSNRVDLANRLMGAVGTRQSLAEQSFQRPSQEYLDAYNQNMAIYAEIKGDAKTEAEKAIDIQTKIEQNQQLANQYAEAASGAAQQANAQLDAIYAQARDQATWAQEQYDLANAEQQKLLTDQLNAITGGMDVSLYTAKLQTDMLAVLDSIDTQITAFLSGNTSPGTTTTTTPAGNTVVNPGNGGGAGGGGGTDGNTLVLQPVNVILDGKAMGQFVMEATTAAITASRRATAYS